MMTAEEKTALVQMLVGSLSQAQLALLPSLCQGAQAGLREQLRPGATGYEEVLDYASVLLVADWVQGGVPEKVTAGDFSISRSAGVHTKTALGLLRPWLVEGFAFRGV